MDYLKMDYLNIPSETSDNVEEERQREGQERR